MACVEDPSIVVVTAVVACLAALSELMGLVSNGPNGVADALRSMAQCLLEYLRNFGHKRPNISSPSASPIASPPLSPVSVIDLTNE